MRISCRMSLAVGVTLLTLMPLPSMATENEVKLPKPAYSGKLSFEASVVRKHSVREFSRLPLTLAEASQVLWAANGNLPADAVTGATTKVIPSAGALYPLEVFLVCGQNTVGKLPAGVYRYNAQGNSLQSVATGDKRNLVAYAAHHQLFLAQAPALIVIAAVFQRTMAKYGDRGVQYVYMDAGAANQNVFLQAESLGLHVAAVGAFVDPQVAGALKLPADVKPIMICAIGK
ncbi:MAG: SagB/ThcOx family dehydrogenase [Desulfomonilaceae bacterium]